MIQIEDLRLSYIDLICFLCRNNNIPKIPEEYNNLMLTWSLFCKETLPDRTFTFWEWFYRLLLLTSHNMGRLWKEGFIMGFVTKQAVEKMLEQQQNGCFILRFSDSELGGVVIAYVRKPEFRKYNDSFFPTYIKQCIVHLFYCCPVNQIDFFF